MKNPAIWIAGFLNTIKYRPRKEPEQIENKAEWKDDQFRNPE
jgi:hypothetical protein